MATTQLRRANTRTIICAPATPDELRLGEVVGDQRRPYSVIVLAGEDGVCQSHALFVLDVTKRRENLLHFRGQLQQRLSEDELAIVDLEDADLEEMSESESLELVPVCGSFDFGLRCGSVLFLPK